MTKKKEKKFKWNKYFKENNKFISVKNFKDLFIMYYTNIIRIKIIFHISIS